MRCLLLVVFVGCGGLSSEDYVEASEDAICDYFVRCGLFATEVDCHAYLDRNSIDDPNVEAALDAGKVVYDEGAAQDCVNSLSSLSCDRTALFGDELEICSGVYTGTLAEGAACGFSGECISDNCVKGTCTMACCLGTCGPARTLPGLGQPCTALCENDAYCGADSICHTPLLYGAPCDTFDSCASGLYCSTTLGTCEFLPHVGEACDAFGGCAELGVNCVSGTCTAAGLPGDPCTNNSQCSTFYTCNGSQCALHPTLGMPCTSQCSDASWCNETTGRCEAQKANGMACTFNDECATHFCSLQICSDVPLCI